MTDLNPALYQTVWSDSFDDPKHSVFGNQWGPGVDLSTPGQITLHTTADNQDSGAMQQSSGASSNQGYGLYSETLQMQGTIGVYGMAGWPATGAWPGPELDMVEILKDGTPYATMHWKGADGSDQDKSIMFSGVDVTQKHTYQMDWEPDHVSFYVDGKEMGSLTDHVPLDYAHGGENESMGIGVQTSWNSGAMDGKNWITVFDASYATHVTGDAAQSAPTVAATDHAPATQPVTTQPIATTPAATTGATDPASTVVADSSHAATDGGASSPTPSPAAPNVAPTIGATDPASTVVADSSHAATDGGASSPTPSPAAPNVAPTTGATDHTSTVVADSSHAATDGGASSSTPAPVADPQPAAGTTAPATSASAGATTSPVADASHAVSGTSAAASDPAPADTKFDFAGLGLHHGSHHTGVHVDAASSSSSAATAAASNTGEHDWLPDVASLAHGDHGAGLFHQHGYHLV